MVRLSFLSFRSAKTPFDLGGGGKTFLITSLACVFMV
jgi:hypothetical protein